MDYQRRVYLEGGYDRVLERCDLSASALHFFTFPSEEETAGFELDITHWSYFENWDPYRNYLVAKEHCGLAENEDSNAGTFTNFAQNDQALYALHTYLMYLKFGFGRANQDAAIEIRRGAMDRAQAVNLVNLYDGTTRRSSSTSISPLPDDAGRVRGGAGPVCEPRPLREGRWTMATEVQVV
jgi:hypothetical protein